MTIEIDNIIFFLDPDMVFTGDETNEDHVNSFNTLKSLHEAMVLEFENPDNLNEFKTLLSENPNTAFTIYNNSKNRFFE